MNEQAHRYEDKLLELAYGELEAREAQSIEAHVKTCARCSSALEQIEGVRKQMSALAPEAAPDAGLESLMAYAEQAARRAQVGPAPSKGLRRWAYALVGATSLAAVLIAVSLVTLKTPASAMAELSPSEIMLQSANEELRRAPPPAAVAAAPTSPPPAPAPAPTADSMMMPAPEPPIANAKPPPPPSAYDRSYDDKRRGGGVERERLAESKKKALLKDSPEYRQNGADRFDKAQNFIPGRGTVPALPKSEAPAAEKKVAAPAESDDAFDGLTSSGKTRSKLSMRQESESVGELAASGGGSGAGNKGGMATSSPEPIARAMDRAESAPKKMTNWDGDSTESYKQKKDSHAQAAEAMPAAPPAPAAMPAKEAPAPKRAAPARPQAAPRDEEKTSGEQYLTQANRVRGSDAEIVYLTNALTAGVSGTSRLEVLERLCKRLVGNDPRSVSYCNTWQREAGSALAEKYAREAKQRWMPTRSQPASVAH